MGRSENVRCKLGVTPGENSDHVREPDELDHRAITAIASFFLSSTWYGCRAGSGQLQGARAFASHLDLGTIGLNMAVIPRGDCQPSQGRFGKHSHTTA